MKKSIKLFSTLCLITLSLSSTYAYDAQEIYEALNIKEVQLNPGIAGVFRLSKKVGRLSCTKSRLVYPGSITEYSCELEEKLQCLIPEGCPRINLNMIDFVIYKALDVEEYDVTPEGLQDAGFFEKEVGGLLCEKSVSYFIGHPGQFYNCELN